MDTFKFIACSDLHIRVKTPRSRKDIFYASQRRKILWLFKTANKYNVPIICGGDVFDNAVIPYDVVCDYINLARIYNVTLLTVYGQHDLRYHVYKSYKNTPLSVLLASLDTIHLLLLKGTK